VIPDVDIAVHVGRDFFLDEKIPRHKSGKGYVRVVEHSDMWKETAASKIFTNKSDLGTLIRAEVEYQDRLEATRCRSPTWRVLRALQSLLSAVQL
jgi:hypothetical protein